MLSLHRPGALLRQLGLDTVYLLLGAADGHPHLHGRGHGLVAGARPRHHAHRPADRDDHHPHLALDGLGRAPPRGARARRARSPASTGRPTAGSWSASRRSSRTPRRGRTSAGTCCCCRSASPTSPIVVTAWSASFGLILTPACWWALPDPTPPSSASSRSTRGATPSWPWPSASSCCRVAAALVRGTAAASGALSRVVLGPSRRQLEERVEVLAQTRAGAVDAAAAELQRIERDLHDGAQARLVALALDLGHGRGALRPRPRGRARARRQGARRGQAGDGRAARPRPRHPPGAAVRARPGRGDRRARRAHAAAHQGGGRPRRAPARAGRARPPTSPSPRR